MGGRAGGGSRGGGGASNSRGFTGEQKQVYDHLVKSGWAPATARKYTSEQWGALQQYSAKHGAPKSIKAKADFISWNGTTKSVTGKQSTY